MPTPPQFLKTAAGAPKKTDPGITNIRNVKSSHWRRWLGVENCCLVPFTSFSEHEVLPDGRGRQCGLPSMRVAHWAASPYPHGEDRLPGLMRVGDLSDARTSVAKIGDRLDGDHHRR